MASGFAGRCERGACQMLDMGPLMGPRAPSLVDFAGGAPNLTDADRAGITMIAMLAGGGVAGLLRQNTVGAATAAENEALNNSEQDHRTPQQKEEDEIKAMLPKEKAALGELLPWCQTPLNS